MKKLSSWIFLFVASLLGVMVLLSALFFVGKVNEFAQELAIMRSYCTPDDPVYQTILSQLDIWDTYFAPTYNSTGSKDFLSFDVPNYRKHIAMASYDDGELTVFVQTRPGWPNTRQGAEGYLYIPSGKSPSGDWEYRFDTISMNQNIYCYNKK